MGHKLGLRREGGRREVWEHLQIKLCAAEEVFHVSALAQTFFFPSPCHQTAVSDSVIHVTESEHAVRTNVWAGSGWPAHTRAHSRSRRVGTAQLVNNVKPPPDRWFSESPM